MRPARGARTVSRSRVSFSVSSAARAAADGRRRLLDLLGPRALRELAQLRFGGLRLGAALVARGERLVDGRLGHELALAQLGDARVLALGVFLRRSRPREVRARRVDRLDARAVRELREAALGHGKLALGLGDARVLPARVELEHDGAGLDAIAFGDGPAQHGLRELGRHGDAVPLERADDRRRAGLRAARQRQRWRAGQ